MTFYERKQDELQLALSRGQLLIAEVIKQGIAKVKEYENKDKQLKLAL